MSVKTRNLTLFTSALAAILLLAAAFFSCESTTLGFGDAIDFIPPVLQFKPEPSSPMYVRAGTELSGIVTDNLSIDRVIARAAKDNEEANIKIGDILFVATLSGSDPKSKTWSIVMNFEEKDNNQKILLEIVAYDKNGNSGDESVLPVTIIVDMQPPVVEDMWIHRTDPKPPANLETYTALTALEETDPDGKEILNVDKYQNGFFTLMGTVAEKETSIKIISLNIYDADRCTENPPLPLVELEVIVEDTDDFSPFSPRWLVSEEELLDAGNLRGWANYKSNYYTANKRYYYRVEIVAIDNSKNESDDDTNIIKQTEGHFVLWANADKPKGIIDLRTDEGKLMGESNVNVQKGTSLPVVFFDDDQLLWAYTGLLTIDQWGVAQAAGTQPIAPGNVLIPAGTDADKLLFLRNRLVDAKDPVLNWKYLKPGNPQEPVIDQIGGRKIFEHTTSVATGNDLTDNGEYRLFTLMKDTKLKPHTNSGSVDTDRPRENLTVYKVNVIDENEPLIVFDTTDPEKVGTDHLGGPPHEMIIGAQTGNSPEENTFPKLTDGKTFTINGYTLRPNKEGQNNRVVYFRIAWIPMGLIKNGQENVIVPQVRRALSATGYPARGPEGTNEPGMDALADEGVKHWNFALNDPLIPHPDNTEYNGTLFTGTKQELEGLNDGSFLKKQVFKKEFNILEDFIYDGELENDIKLFIFYAEDDMGHIVFRELRLLGNQTPPEITIYDLTTRDANFSMNYGDATNPQLPNLNHDNPAQTAYYFFSTKPENAGNIDDAGREKYRKKLLEYQPTGYSILRNIAMPGGTLAPSLPGAELNAVYPRDTTIKYWVTAKSGGFLEIKNIQMRDVTFAVNAPYNAGSYLGRRYNENSISTPTSEPVYVGGPVEEYKDDLSLSFVEMLPEVTQRVLLFTAKDSLNNTVSIQRTVTVTNAAVLNNITTTTQTGAYGIGTTITLQANFSNLVEWTGTNPPLLNVRYTKNNVNTILQIPADITPATGTPAGTPTLSLKFNLVVAENDTGIVQTMYSDIPNDGKTWTTTPSNAVVDRPITLPANTAILDYERGDNAFTPGNVPGFNWTDAGRGPSNSLQGSKQIRLDGVRPTISSFTPYIPAGTTKTQYTDANGGYYFKLDETIYFTLTANKPIFTNGNPVIEFQVGGAGAWHPAAWLRSSSANAMVFSAQVNSTTVQGSITGIRLTDASTIVDGVSNAFAGGTGTLTVTTSGLTGSNTIRIDRTAPPAPPTTLDNVSTATAPELYRTNPVLRVTRDAVPTGEITVPPKTEYSLDNGVTWVEFPNVRATWTTANGTTALNILNGQWTLKTRFTDRAGNVGNETTKPIHVNMTFPNLIAVTAVNPDGWYRLGANLSFKLDFAEPVRVQTAGTVQIVLTNRGSGAVQAGTGENNIILSAADGQTSIDRSGNTTITFNWNNIPTNKEMRNGMYISYIRLNGLLDRFGNTGPAINANAITYTTSTSNPSPIGGASGPFANPAIPNLGIGVKVDTIAPTVTARVPAATSGVATAKVSATDFRNTITLTFREPVMKGNGTITIKPETGFLIPPVFENDGYYLDYETDARSTSSVQGRTSFVAGFYDVYNSGLSAAQRNALTEGTTETSQTATPAAGTIPSSATDNGNPSMSRLRLNDRTGQPFGPYIRTTHGLTAGNGYTGQYSGATYTDGPNTNQAGASHMIPDTATKWVLDYQYSITGTGTAITNIRNALKAAKFRWQEIDVVSTNVVVNGATVTITLNEPLLKGLQWDLSFPAGTFTDEAGNNAGAQAEASYTFWSEGAQKPVIRVNRKSYDARTSNWHVPTNANNTGGYTYGAPADTNTSAGWGLGDFNTVHYRIETETPGAAIFYGTSTPANSTSTAGNGAFDAVTGAWTGNVANSANGNGYTQVAWNTISTGPTNNIANQWVRPNLIYRAGSANNYTVNGITRQSGGAYALLRSYNRDATTTTLNALIAAEPTGTPASTTSAYEGNFTFGALEAGKRYVAAVTRKTQGTTNYYSAMGYEGAFRTMIMLFYSDARANNYRVVVEGSNIKNGMPSIAGFPVKDAPERGDSRFIKMFNRNATNGPTQFIWVSTEIVSEWYFIKFGGGNGSHMNIGEVNNYLMVSYGDLTYGRNITSSGE